MIHNVCNEAVSKPSSQPAWTSMMTWSINVPTTPSMPASRQRGRLLALDERPTAIVCAGDVVALGVIHGVRETGLRVPNDVAIIGYGDIPFAAASSPTLTTVRLPADELGREAVRALRRAIDDGAPQPPLTVATSLTLRHSCGCSSDAGEEHAYELTAVEVQPIHVRRKA